MPTIQRIRVQEVMGFPALCEVAFIDSLAGPIVSPSLGESLRIELPDEGGLLFTGEVTALSHAYESNGLHTLTVRAYDVLHRLRKRQSMRAFIDITLGALIGVQHRQSDFGLLLEVCRRAGLFPIVAGETLRLVSLEGYGHAVQLTLGEKLLEAEVEANGDKVLDSVESLAWNALTVDVHRAVATNPRGGAEIGSSVSAGDVGGSGDRYLVNGLVFDEAQAGGLAQAELDIRAASGATIRGVAEGTAELHVGMPVEVSGVDDDFAGRYVVTYIF
jgi:hypothetical protein